MLENVDVSAALKHWLDSRMTLDPCKATDARPLTTPIPDSTITDLRGDPGFVSFKSLLGHSNVWSGSGFRMTSLRSSISLCFWETMFGTQDLRGLHQYLLITKRQFAHICNLVKQRVGLGDS